MTTSRREFLGCAAAAWLAAETAGADDSDVSIPIIDTHVHLWDLTKIRLPWLAGAPELNQDALWSDYQEATTGLNIAKAVYLEVDVDPAQHETEARLIIETIRSGRTALVAAVIGGRPASEGFNAYIEPLAKESVVKGLRQVLHGKDTPPGYCLQPDFIKGIQRLGELGLGFDLCMRHAELSDGAELVEAAPETRFILDHCGNPPIFGDLSAWRRDIDRLAARPNVSGKISGIIASTQGRSWKADDLAPVIHHMLEAFGPDRVMFGGDWPVCTLGAPLREWVAALREVVGDKDSNFLRKLFHDNALRIYQLS